MPNSEYRSRKFEVRLGEFRMPPGERVSAYLQAKQQRVERRSPERLFRINAAVGAGAGKCRIPNIEAGMFEVRLANYECRRGKGYRPISKRNSNVWNAALQSGFLDLTPQSEPEPENAEFRISKQECRSAIGELRMPPGERVSVYLPGKQQRVERRSPERLFRINAAVGAGAGKCRIPNIEAGMSKCDWRISNDGGTGIHQRQSGHYGRTCCIRSDLTLTDFLFVDPAHIPRSPLDIRIFPLPFRC